MNCPLQTRNLYRNGEKKFNSIFINQLIHFFFSTPLSAHIECALFSFDAVEKKHFGSAAGQAIGDNPELEAIIDYCTKRAASFILILP